jgi:hypothetical protein
MFSDLANGRHAGLVPGIHVLEKKDVDGRDKPGHDERGSGCP